MISPDRITDSLFYEVEGNPKLFLTGSHPEITSSSILTGSFKTAFRASNQEQSKLAEALQPTDTAHKIFLQKAWRKLGITCKELDLQPEKDDHTI